MNAWKSVPLEWRKIYCVVLLIALDPWMPIWIKGTGADAVSGTRQLLDNDQEQHVLVAKQRQHGQSLTGHRCSRRQPRSRSQWVSLLYKQFSRHWSALVPGYRRVTFFFFKFLFHKFQTCLRKSRQEWPLKWQFRFPRVSPTSKMAFFFRANILIWQIASFGSLHSSEYRWHWPNKDNADRTEVALGPPKTFSL